MRPKTSTEGGKTRALAGPLIQLRRVVMSTTKKCDFCPHSRAAHTDGIHCALCRCRSERRELVQETLAFRGTIPVGRPAKKSSHGSRIVSARLVVDVLMPATVTRTPKLTTVPGSN